MYKYVVWDFDGTLIDSYGEALDEYKEILDGMNVHPDMNLIKDYLIRYTSKETKEYLHDAYGIDINEFNKQYEILSNTDKAINNFKFLDDSYDAVCALNDLGIKNFIQTNRDYCAVKTIENLNALDAFEDIVYIGKDGLKERKPNPEGMEYILNKYNLDPKEVLYVGDRDLDVITCEKVNVDCALYNPIEGYTSNPKYIISKFMDLVNIVK